MKRIISSKKVFIWALCLSVIGLLSFKVGDKYFEISKNLELYASVFREINTYYVDEIDAGKMNKKAIDEMLKTLDPYTNFISEAEAEDFRFQMTGQYGGVGAQIMQRDDYVMVTDPYEGFAAQKADLRAGDILIEVDGKSVKGKNTSDISKLLKGQAGSEVKLLIKRGNETLTKSIIREEIKLKNVPYFGMINAETGYIKLTSFTNDAGNEVRNALVGLKKQNAKNVILDVRGNPGGLLNEAVNIVNVFVPQGQLVVSTKGKISEWDKSYPTQLNSTDINIPVVVLTSRGSASASEIVSGVIQDLDRGVVIGQRTFGKGLVQTTRPLSYNAQMKITTAKYYIPSGRCIQALDYSHRNDDGSVGKIPDSLIKEFKTKSGRKVYDGGGVAPDFAVEVKKLSHITQNLISKNILFDYANLYASKNNNIAPAKNFKLSKTEYDEFIKYVQSQNFEYKTKSEKMLDDYKEIAIKEKYFDAVKQDYETLRAKLLSDKNADLIKFEPEIREILEEEIAARYYYQKGRIEKSLVNDPEVAKALEVLGNQQLYSNTLKKTDQSNKN
jgi:carboxyl-terminal processing protease